MFETHSVPGTPPELDSTSVQTDDVDFTVPESPPTVRLELPVDQEVLRREYEDMVAEYNAHLHPQNYAPSEEVRRLMGNRAPPNTKKSNISSLRALARFLTADMPVPEEITGTNDDLRSAGKTLLDKTIEWKVQKARELLFPSPDGGHLPNGYADWNDDQLKHLRSHLREFVVRYQFEKTEEEVKPNTMKFYIAGIQRALESEWGYKLRILEGPVFACPTDGLMSVLNNRFSEQQAKGSFVENHNVLERDDLLKLFKSDRLCRDTPQGFQARLVFGVGLSTAMRPSELVYLKRSQLQKLKVRGEMVWRIRKSVGSLDGSAKVSRKGWNAAKEKPVEITIWNRDQLDGLLNLYKDLEDYVSVRDKVDIKSDRFFLNINHKAQSFETFFKKQAMGKNKLSEIVRETCRQEGIKGSGNNEVFTTHGLRGTTATLLFESGHADSSVAMRTGHRDMRSLKHYQGIGGCLGQRQQDDIFGSRNEMQAAKRKLEAEEETKDGAKREKLDAGRSSREEVVVDEKLEGDEKGLKLLSGIKSSRSSREEVVVDEKLEGDENGLKLLSGIKSIRGGTVNINIQYQ